MELTHQRSASEISRFAAQSPKCLSLREREGDNMSWLQSANQSSWGILGNSLCLVKQRRNKFPEKLKPGRRADDEEQSSAVCALPLLHCTESRQTVVHGGGFSYMESSIYQSDLSAVCYQYYYYCMSDLSLLEYRMVGHLPRYKTKVWVGPRPVPKTYVLFTRQTAGDLDPCVHRHAASHRTTLTAPTGDRRSGPVRRGRANVPRDGRGRPGRV